MIDYIYTNDPTKQAVIETTKLIKEHLIRGEQVLWLLSGGSGITIAVEVSKRLKLLDLSRLSVSLTDERFGIINHDNENWKQLLDAGFILPKANLYRPLIGKDIVPTTVAFGDWLFTQLENSDFKIGIFGIGIDGHTAGIKPRSSAVSSPNLTASFIGSDFARITITFPVIKQLDMAIIQVSGKNKLPIIHSLFTNSQSLDNQPAQIFKELPHATLYTDNKENL